MLDEPILCEFCVAENELRLELQERGVPVDKCLLCHQSGGRALPATDNRVTRIFRALVRLNFSEWDYNTHVGGASLQSVVFASKATSHLFGASRMTGIAKNQDSAKAASQLATCSGGVYLEEIRTRPVCACSIER